MIEYKCRHGNSYCVYDDHVVITEGENRIYLSVIDIQDLAKLTEKKALTIHSLEEV